MTSVTSVDITQAIHDAYSTRAKTGIDESYSRDVAQAFGYTAEQLQMIPAESNLGLSCGNPVAAANIKMGEVVLDLGCGGGIDVLLAASKVGATGQVIGLDMSRDMIARARSNAQKQNLRPPQVAFVHKSLTDPLPISSDSIDCILSNCVVNLLSDKGNLFKEAYRVLKPGGRIVFDDVIAKKVLPNDIRNDPASHIGCIAGAIEADVYKRLLVDAGFSDVLFVNTGRDIGAYSLKDQPSTVGCCSVPLGKPSCCSPASTPARPASNFDAKEWVSFFQIYALKPSYAPSDSAGKAINPLLKWWDAYPGTKSTVETISSDELVSMIRNKDMNQSDYVIVDVRGNDHTGDRIRASIQCSAQTFYDDLPDFFNRFGRSGKVIFYCDSCRGRGPRCAGWYQDLLNDKGIAWSKAYVLEGGMKAWLEKFGQDAELVDKDY